MKNSKLKNVIICLLLVVIAILGSYIILNNSTRTSSFLADIMLLQNKLSYYVGSINSETFEAYSNVEILTALTEDGKEIKGFDEKNLIAFANKDEAIESNGVTLYKLNIENIKNELNIDLSQYSSVTFYVQDGVNISVRIIEEPKWWDDNFDLLKI